MAQEGVGKWAPEAIASPVVKLFTPETSFEIMINPQIKDKVESFKFMTKKDVSIQSQIFIPNLF